MSHTENRDDMEYKDMKFEQKEMTPEEEERDDLIRTYVEDKTGYYMP